MTQCEVTIDDSETIVSVEGDALEVLGAPNGFWEGRGLREIIPDRFHRAHDRGYERYTTTGVKRAMGTWVEVPLRRADGTEQRVELCVTEMNGILTGMIRLPDADRNLGMTAIEEYLDEIERIYVQADAANEAWHRLGATDVDRIVTAVHEAAVDAADRLAEMARDETGMGRVESKVAKNRLASEQVYAEIMAQPTVGVIGRDGDLVEYGAPMGTVLCITPVTNPTATAITKIMCNLKARNSSVILPASKARHSTIEAARVMYEAAVGAGAPEHCVQWFDSQSRRLTQAVISEKRNALILATGGAGLVEAAYTSGTPALGVGAGNVPVLVDGTADLEHAAECLIESKTFDNGVICASEQAVVATADAYDGLVAALEERRAALVDETPALTWVLIDDKRGTMRPSIVGQTAHHIAKQAGVSVEEDTTLLVIPQTEVGDEAPLSQEILAPVIALYRAEDTADAIGICEGLIAHHGQGHSAVIHSTDDDVIMRFIDRIDAGRIMVNVGSSLGAVGVGTPFGASFTLGCGTSGKNITTDNITAKHLINVRRIAWADSTDPTGIPESQP